MAIKLEQVTAKSQQLAWEYKVYRALKGGIGIPSVYYYGVEGAYNVVVMELLGPSLQDMFEYCNFQFSLKTICMLAQEMLLRLEYVHNKFYIHRDMKPDNFGIGLGKGANVIYVFDFGLSKRYRHSITKAHIPYDSSIPVTVGTTKISDLSERLDMHPSVIIWASSKAVATISNLLDTFSCTS